MPCYNGKVLLNFGILLSTFSMVRKLFWRLLYLDSKMSNALSMCSHSPKMWYLCEVLVFYYLIEPFSQLR